MDLAVKGWCVLVKLFIIRVNAIGLIPRLQLVSILSRVVQLKKRVICAAKHKYKQLGFLFRSIMRCRGQGWAYYISSLVLLLRALLHYRTSGWTIYISGSISFSHSFPIFHHLHTAHYDSNQSQHYNHTATNSRPTWWWGYDCVSTSLLCRVLLWNGNTEEKNLFRNGVSVFSLLQPSTTFNCLLDFRIMRILREGYYLSLSPSPS